mgnify:CR=1 FL=1
MIKKIIDTIKSKVVKKEGFTEVINSKVKKYRYVVGGREVYKSKKINKASVTRALNKNKSGFKSYDTIGGWHDEDTGTYYLDFGKVFTNKKKALEVAKKRKEIAIWDTKEEKEIRV